MPKVRRIAVRADYPAQLVTPLPKQRWVKGKWVNAAEWRARYMDNLYLLLEWHGIDKNDPGALSKLSLRLLSEFLAGFRPQRQGRPLDSSLSAKKQRLLAAFTAKKMARPKLSASAFCANISKSRDLGESEFHGQKPETLRRWLREAQQDETVERSVIGAPSEV